MSPPPEAESVPGLRLLPPHTDLHCRLVEFPAGLRLAPRRQITLVSSLVFGGGVSVAVFGLLVHWAYGSFWRDLVDLLSGKLFATFDRDLILYGILGLACGAIVVLAGLGMDAYQKRRGSFLEAHKQDRLLRLPRRGLETPFSAVLAIEWIQVDSNEQLSDGRRETFTRCIQVNIVHESPRGPQRTNLITLSREASEEDDLRSAVEKLTSMIGVKLVEDLAILQGPDYRAWKRGGSRAKL